MAEYKIDMPETITDAQLDALMDDWFDRDGKTFVHKRTEGRLGWESRLAGDSAYSEFILAAPTIKELISRAYPLGRDTLVAMDLPRKVGVKISNTRDSFTDGKNVFLSTKVFDEPSMEPSEKLDVFLGLAIHEGCHVLWTDFRINVSETPLRRMIVNVLEDERIEVLCGEERPGFANFLEKVKKYYFDLYYLRFTKKHLEERGTLLDKFMDMFLKIIRFPKYLDESLFIKFYKYLVKIKEVVVPYPTSTKEVYDAAKKIEDIIYEFYRDEMTKEREEAVRAGASRKEESGSGDYTESVRDALSKLLSSKSLDEMDDSTEEKSETSSDTDEEDKSESGADGGSTDKPEKADKPEVPVPTVSEIRARIAEDSSKSDFKETLKEFGDAKDKDVSVVIKKDGEFAKVADGSIILGSNTDVQFEYADPTSSSYQYDESLSRVNRYVPAISRILKSHAQEYRYILKGMRSGKLDTNKLAEAFQGVPSVYLREGEVQTEKISVCLLIDESGSMAGSREVSARDTGILINEAIGKVPNVDLFIYGHTGDIGRTGVTNIIIYREPNFNSKKALGSCRARSENRDGVAITEVAKRVRKFTQENVLLFVISDGAPSACDYRGMKAINHTKECVDRVEKMGFNIVQICINRAAYDPSSMFKHFVVLENMSTLSLDLSKVIKAALLKHTKKSLH